MHVGDSFSTVGDTFSTVEVVRYSGGQHQCIGRIVSELWRVFSTLGDNISTCRGITSVHAGNNISTVEGIQYSGGYLQYSGGYLQYSEGIPSVQ